MSTVRLVSHTNGWVLVVIPPMETVLMSGKPQPFKRTRRSTRRSGWKKGPSSWKRLFLNEMKRTNNVLSAIKYARITWSCYQEWVTTGFLSDQELKDAEAVFHQRHPKVDIIVKHSDQSLEDEGFAVAPVETVEAVGYDERSVLNEDGWIHSDDWTDDV